MIASLMILLCSQLYCQDSTLTDLKSEKKTIPLVISWDDNYVDDWYKIKDTLNYYGVKCTFFVCRFNALSKRQIEKLKVLQQEGHEIGVHSRDHVDAENYSNRYGIDKYIQDEIIPEIDSMKNCGIHPVSFAYPFGHGTGNLNKALSSYFTAIRGTTLYSKPVYRKSLLLNGFGMDDNYCSLDAIFHELESDYKKGQFVILLGHTPSSRPFSIPRYYTSIDRLVKIIEKAKSLGFTFCTMSELSLMLNDKSIASKPASIEVHN
jgi:peptidoglycan/xylan/chitin deacetylase (PgdA/CDA1 family)